MSDERYTREELAALEVGRTTVSPPMARFIVAAFLLLVFTVPTLQELIGLKGKVPDPASIFYDNFSNAFGPTPSDSLIDRIDMVNDRLLQAVKTTEEELEDKTLLHALFWPMQKTLLLLGKGNEKVLPGKDGWLFYSKDVDHLLNAEYIVSNTHPGKSATNDPVSAIVDFRDKLRQRGVELVVVPTPVKPMIYPDKISRFRSAESLPLYSSGWGNIRARLEENGIHLIDPAPLLTSYVREQKNPAYLRTDTHWTPGAMETVARYIASYVYSQLQMSFEQIKYKRETESVVNQGDIAVMLKLPTEKIRLDEEVEIHPVLTGGSELWRQSSSGNVLLLGDSFSNIYSEETMGWGNGAGFGEQLSFYLKSPIDTILQNDQGAYVTREQLAAELARGIDRLKNTKLVIWQFAARELTQGEWKIIELPESRLGGSDDFYLVPTGEERLVHGEIRDISRSPRPGSVPYKDNIITLHLVNVEDAVSGEVLGDCLVYTWGMKNNELTKIATGKIGETITMKLQDWAAVESEYAALRRSALDDEMIEYEMPNWGELIQWQK